MKKIYFMLVITAISVTIQAQKKAATTDTSQIKKLDEVIVSASNFAEKRKNIAQAIDVINAKTIANTNAQNTGDLLMSTGKIFVQKSQQGGSSPVVRGFEASRILLIVDGVRMNNLIYRSGHLQNAISVDQNSLSRVEVSYGPSSTIYGSDALGGAIQFITKAPVFSTTNKTLLTGSAFARYSSANSEKPFHADMSVGNKNAAWFQSINYSDFGDVKMGNKYLSAYPNFGRRATYVDMINGIDSVVNNTNDNTQKFSGYKQWDVIEKFSYKITDKVTHGLNFQFSNTTDVPRYDRLQDVKNFGGAIGTTLRYAKWYYGPQKRFLGAYNLNIGNTGFFDEIKANINYQRIEESRITREYRRYDRLDSRIENVKVFGATLNARKLFKQNELVVGLDVQLNKLNSTATRQNILTLLTSKLDTRYPDGNNQMNNFALYAQHIFKSNNKKFVLNDGIRLQSSNLKSNIKDNSFFKLPDTSVTQKNISLTGNVGLVYNAAKNTVVKFGISSGFRAPNIDDLAKVFESSTAAKQVVLPNANLKPEYTYNAELSLNQNFNNVANVEITTFYTMFRDAIIKAPFTINGQDSIIYNGVKSQILASQNINKANVYGFTISADTKILKSLSVATTLSYTEGYFITDATKKYNVYEKQANGTYALVSKNVSKKPLDHIPPMMSKTTISYEIKKLSTSAYLMYNGWKKLDKYNTDGEDNEQYATSDGMPAWFTLNWNANYNITKNVKVQAAVENILDRNYRYFASGFSAPGRNFILALRANW
jgi:hemoglobin/transferrin/lactoferrin receptor protein